MCFRPPTAQIDDDGKGASNIPGASKAPVAPGAPVPKSPKAPGAPKVSGAPSVPGETTKKESVSTETDASGSDAEFMGDAPGAKIQSCVPTLKVKSTESKETPFVPPAPK